MSHRVMRVLRVWTSAPRRADEQGRPGDRRGGGRLRLLAAISSSALVLAGVGAAPAWAEEPHFTAKITCTSVTYSFSGFPNAADNTVVESVYADTAKIATETFQFNGPSGMNTIAISLSPGTHTVEASAKWDTNGATGEMDVGARLTCPEPVPCTHAFGSGHFGPHSPKGIDEDNNLTTNREKHELQVKFGKGFRFALRELTTATCLKGETFAVFSGTGIGRFDEEPGAEATFSFEVKEGIIYFTLIIEKEGEVLFKLVHRALNPGSKETIE